MERISGSQNYSYITKVELLKKQQVDPAKAAGNSIRPNHMNMPQRGHCFYETERSQTRCLLHKPCGLFRSGVKKCDCGSEPDCFYVDLIKTGQGQAFM